MGVTSPIAGRQNPRLESFTASRWTQGNFLFPTRLVVSPLRVSRVKSRLFGSDEESIPMSKVASVHISTGVFWSEIVDRIHGRHRPHHQPRPSQNRCPAHPRPDRALSRSRSRIDARPRRRLARKSSGSFFLAKLVDTASLKLIKVNVLSVTLRAGGLCVPSHAGRT